ncbi:MAG: hypothetical protein ACE5IT_01445 [bacterium]
MGKDKLPNPHPDCYQDAYKKLSASEPKPEHIFLSDEQSIF